MDYSINELFYDMSVFNDRMDDVDIDNEAEIVHFCEPYQSAEDAVFKALGVE